MLVVEDVVLEGGVVVEGLVDVVVVIVDCIDVIDGVVGGIEFVDYGVECIGVGVVDEFVIEVVILLEVFGCLEVVGEDFVFVGVLNVWLG